MRNDLSHQTGHRKSNEAYQDVLDKLSDYDIVGMAWEEEPAKKVLPPGQKAGDMGATLSQSIDRLTGGR